MELARRKPNPIPAIHPLPEYLAQGQRLNWYGDMKQVFQVPWMGVVTMAFSHYPYFFDTLWQGTRDLCASQPYVAACMENRAFAETKVKGLNPTPLKPTLADLGYAPREVDDIRQMVEVFSHGNQPYLIMATLARYLLEGGEMTGAGDARAFNGQHAPGFNVPFVLMEAHHADADTRVVYEDIKVVLGLPFVNTDYRALARWPSYWQAAWADLRPKLVASGTDRICEDLHQRTVGLVRDGLPNLGVLTSGALISAAKQDAPLDEIIAMCRLFQWLLPGLVTNVAYLRAQLL